MTCASFSACRPRILVESPFNASCRNPRHHLDTYTRPLAVAVAKAQSRFVQDTQKFMTLLGVPVLPWSIVRAYHDVSEDKKNAPQLFANTTYGDHGRAAADAT